MATTPRQAVLRNPFFVLLLLASTAFVVTALAYAIGPSVLDRAERGHVGPRSLALTMWLDRNGPMVLGAEILAVMLTGTLAMLTDSWFAPKAKG